MQIGSRGCYRNFGGIYGGLVIRVLWFDYERMANHWLRTQMSTIFMLNIYQLAWLREHLFHQDKYSVYSVCFTLNQADKISYWLGFCLFCGCGSPLVSSASHRELVTLQILPYPSSKFQDSNLVGLGWIMGMWIFNKPLDGYYAHLRTSNVD